MCSTHDWILFFTSAGRVYRTKAYNLPEASRDAKGGHVAGLLSFQPDEKIAQVEKLGGDVTDLEQAKSEIEEELRRNKRATGKEIKALKDRVEGYEMLLKTKDEEIAKLQSVNKELLT